MFLFWCYPNVYNNAKISLVLEKHAIEKHIWNEIFAQEYNKGGKFICPNENLQKRNNSFYECISRPNWVVKFIRPNTPSFISREFAIIKLFYLKMFNENKIERHGNVEIIRFNIWFGIQVVCRNYEFVCNALDNIIQPKIMTLEECRRVYLYVGVGPQAISLIWIITRKNKLSVLITFGHLIKCLRAH